MKKIFAIALALVMVLSMASAFASQCTTGPFAWDCATKVSKCGKATIEVIPYVKVNNACGGFDWQVSTCASAVNSETVHYVVKLSVDANPDAEWFNAPATYTVSAKGLAGSAADAAAEKEYKYTGDFAEVHLTGDKAKKAQVYYMNNYGEWVLYDEDVNEEDDFVQTLYVFKASKAKVCATIESKNEFSSATVGDYTVTYEADVATDTDLLIITDDDDNYVEFIIEDEEIVDIWANGTACKKTPDFVKEVLAFFNLGCGWGVCVTEDAINANFGWDDEVEHCFSWSDKAASIVDAECVVAIPKTGDASVLAWLF